MHYIRSTEKTFDRACKALESAVSDGGFSVLGMHDLGDKLRSKGLDFSEHCRVFEVCNPKQAARVLAADMTMNMALPCRISVYTENGEVKIGMLRPKDMLAMLSQDPELSEVAGEVEQATIRMIDQAC